MNNRFQTHESVFNHVICERLRRGHIYLDGPRGPAESAAGRFQGGGQDFESLCRFTKEERDMWSRSVNTQHCIFRKTKRLFVFTWKSVIIVICGAGGNNVQYNQKQHRVVKRAGKNEQSVKLQSMTSCPKGLYLIRRRVIDTIKVQRVVNNNSRGGRLLQATWTIRGQRVIGNRCERLKAELERFKLTQEGNRVLVLGKQQNCWHFRQRKLHKKKKQESERVVEAVIGGPFCLALLNL